MASVPAVIVVTAVPAATVGVGSKNVPKSPTKFVAPTGLTRNVPVALRLIAAVANPVRSRMATCAMVVLVLHVHRERTSGRSGNRQVASRPRWSTWPWP